MTKDFTTPQPVDDSESAFAPEASPALPVEEVATGITHDGRLRSGRLAGLTMNRAILTLAGPILAESFLNSLVGLTDTVLAAGIDDGGAAADAIGGAAYTLWFISLIVAALGVGSTALIARAVGARRRAAADAALTQTLLLAAISSVAVGGILALMAHPVAQLLNLTPAAKEAFETFLLINAAGVPFMSVLFCGIACARGAGDSIRPLRAMVAVNIVNLIASWALSGIDLTTMRTIDGTMTRHVILANPFEFNMGVAGIALGTVLGHCVGAALIIKLVIRGTGGVRLRVHRLRPHRATIARLVRLGWPNFLETFGMWAGNFLIILFVGWMSPPAGGLLGAHVIATRIEAFSFLAGFAMGAAAATLVGQYLGAGSATLARQAVWRCTAIAVAMMTPIGLLFIFKPEWCVGLLTSQPAHLQYSPTPLMIAGFIQLPFAVSIVLRSALRGSGDVRGAMWITWITTYLIRLPLSWLLCGVDLPIPGIGTLPNPSPWEGGLSGLWLGLCIEIVCRAAIFTWRFMGGKWSRTRV